MTVSPEVTGYIVDIARATRQSPSLSLGASPRAATALMATSRAWAWLSGREFVTPDDVKALAHATLAHRLVPATGGRARGRQRRVRAGQRPVLRAGPTLTPAVPPRSVLPYSAPLTWKRMVPVALTGRAPALLALGLVAGVAPADHDHRLDLVAGHAVRRRARPAARAEPRASS